MACCRRARVQANLCVVSVAEEQSEEQAVRKKRSGANIRLRSSFSQHARMYSRQSGSDLLWSSSTNTAAVYGDEPLTLMYPFVCMFAACVIVAFERANKKSLVKATRAFELKHLLFV